MSLFQSILLGIVQGLTEFLPVSSSGHLVIVPFLLGWKIPSADAFIFDVLVQVATLVAVFAYFWKDLIQIIRSFITSLLRKQPFADPDARLGWYILLATIPAGAIGLLLKDAVENAFSSPRATGIFLLVTAVLLFTAERVGSRRRNLEQLNWVDALFFGFFQALAIFPGVSRSGSTITGGMLRNIERAPAARFSFLMSIPIMLAAGGLAFLDMLKIPNLGSLIPVYIPGFLAAAVVGYIAIRWLLSYLMQHSLNIFAIYCACLGTITILLSFVLH